MMMATAPTVGSILTGGYLEIWFPVLAAHRVAFWVGWPGFVCLFIFLWFANEHLLPSAVIRTSESESFFQKHIAVLTLAFTAVGALAAVISAYVALFGGSAGK